MREWRILRNVPLSSTIYGLPMSNTLLLIRRAACILLLCGLVWALAGEMMAAAQEIPPLTGGQNQQLEGVGWDGFKDYRFLWNATLTLLLATVLGAIIGYHPKNKRTMESIEEVETPKIFIMYAVVGAVIGIMVLYFGLVIGFVVFGIGGLIRFRTDLRSATKTGRVMFVTLIGLCTGLELPHVAVLATTFGFILFYILDARTTYRIMVKGLQLGTVLDTAEIYRSVLEQQGCRILSEKKDFNKSQIAFVFRTTSRLDRDDLVHLFEVEVPEEIRGAVDWQAG